MTRQIRFNAFDMNCVAHLSSGMWRHPDDRSAGGRRILGGLTAVRR